MGMLLNNLKDLKGDAVLQLLGVDCLLSHLGDVIRLMRLMR